MEELTQIYSAEGTLLDTLLDPRTYPLPLIGLAAILVILSEIYCLKKSGRLESSYATVSLLIYTGVGFMCALFKSNSTVVSMSFDEPRFEGMLRLSDRIPIETWYLPSVAGIICLLMVLFTMGVIKDLKDKKTRIAIVRVPVFLLILYLAVSTVSVPYKMNHQLELLEKEYLSQRE